MTTSFISKNGQSHGISLNGSSPATAAQTPSAASAELLADHLAAHRDFLTTQLDLAKQLTALLSAEAAKESPRKEVLDSIGATAWNSAALGQAHASANNALNTLAGGSAATPQPTGTGSVAGLDLGAAPAVTPPAATSTAQPAPLATETIAATVIPAPAAPAVAPITIDTPAAAATAVAPVTAETTAAATATGTTAGMDADTARWMLYDIVAEKTGYPATMLEPSMDMEADLGIDSIKRVEIMGAMRDRYPSVAQVPLDEIGEMRTLDDVAGFLARYGGAADSAPKA
ncbi:phosphopantetheine-binding protein [Nocardia sp. NPDC051570]|uniref:phosphopantetheine-binding protein n=1 Tax=Nocardia sp. NPDC051570 TaxID=3364324 RepID=UPI003795F4A2